MTISIAQTKSAAQAGAPATLTITATSTPTVGRSIIIPIGMPGDNGIATVVDNQGGGNVFVKVKEQFDSTGGGDHAVSSLWWCPSLVTASGTYTVTATPVTPAEGANGAIGLIEASSTLGALSVDQISGAADVAGASTSLTVTNPSANAVATDLAVSLICVSSGDTTSFAVPPSSGYTALIERSLNTDGMCVTAGYKILTGIETTAASASWGATGFAAGALVTFKEPGAAPQVISQVQNSSATTLTSLVAPAITPSASDSLAVFTLSSTGSGLILNDAGVGNNYRHVGGGNSGGTFFLDAYLAQNVIGSPTTITVSAGAASIYAIAVVDVKQCAINNGALGFNVHAQTGSGTAGANLIFSNTIPLANPALMLAINVDLGLLGACTAGTSPIAFTGQTPIWATFGAGTAVAVIESALINSTQQATFGSTAANKSDNFITLAMDIGYFLTFTLQPFTPVQFFVTDTVIQM